MRTPLPLLGAAAVAALVAGCGGSGDRPHYDAAARATILGHRSGIDRHHSSAQPTVRGPVLLQIRRTGWQFGTSDIVTYGRDGSAVVIRAYGGGGYYARRCRLSPAELARLVRDVGRLPLGKAPHVKERPRPTFYTLPAESYVVEHGTYIGSFTVDAVPRGGRAMMHHVLRLLRGTEGRCKETYATRT